MENLNNGWIHRESRLPAETDGDSTGKVFAWHAYQGVMLTRWDDFPKNSFNIYWMCLSEGIKARGSWQRKESRPRKIATHSTASWQGAAMATSA